MHFKNDKEVIKATTAIRNKAGKESNIHWPILFKKALTAYAEKHGINSLVLSQITGISKSSLYKWSSQYAEGLYTMAGAYAVSHKSLSTNQMVIKKLKQDIADIETKLALVEQCEKLGLKLAA